MFSMNVRKVQNSERKSVNKENIKFKFYRVKKMKSKMAFSNIYT